VPFSTHVTDADFYWIPMPWTLPPPPRALLQGAMTALEKRHLGKE